MENFKKFQCHYRLLINWTDRNGTPQQAIVQDPITIEFNVVKSTQSENSSQITIYNLDASTREAIYQDVILMDNNPYIKWVTLEAGYGEHLSLVTWGYIRECHSYRSGVDFITTMDVIDPDILTEYCGVTFEAGTTFEQAYKYLISQLPSLKVGETGVLNGIFNMPTVFNGNTFVLINKLTGGHTFVDNGVINNLNDNETLSDYGCYYIASDTGLLETPKRYNSILEVTMLFEPTLKIGQMVEIQSDTWGTKSLQETSGFDGQYKLLGFTHSCTISGSENGTRTSILQLQYIRDLTNSNINLTQNPEGSRPSTVKNNQVQPINIKVGSDIESIYRYIKEHNGQVPTGKAGKITNRISWREMIYAGKNHPQDVKNQITPTILASCKEIATRLTDFVDTYFPSNKIKITSGYRTRQNNANTENSANKSNHVKGAAIDFKLDGIGTTTLTKRFLSSWRYGLGTYSWGLHISLNPRERFRGRG